MSLEYSLDSLQLFELVSRENCGRKNNFLFELLKVQFFFLQKFLYKICTD